MSTTPRPERAERTRTDDSLATEREKTDDALEKRGALVEESADHVVADARARADAVLDGARARADEQLREKGAESDQLAVVHEERRKEDVVVQRERSIADDQLSDERAARRRALLALLALERGETDDHLLRERTQADHAIGSRDDFLGMASHDLRNMLGGIAMSASSMLRITADPAVRDAIARDATRIQRYVARMNRLVGDLVDVVSIEAGHLAVVPTPNDTADVLRDAMDVFEPLAAAKRIAIGAEVRGGSLLARYDPERILQVLANLVGNAIKFTPGGGRIDVLVERCGDEARFAVTDTGPGIAEDQLGVIFERFWQVDRTTRSGMGLGLYISRRIVEAHGGRLWADSRPGEGSTFFFTLPMVATEASPRGGD